MNKELSCAFKETAVLNSQQQLGSTAGDYSMFYMVQRKIHGKPENRDGVWSHPSISCPSTEKMSSCVDHKMRVFLCQGEPHDVGGSKKLFCLEA